MIFKIPFLQLYKNSNSINLRAIQSTYIYTINALFRIHLRILINLFYFFLKRILSTAIFCFVFLLDSKEKSLIRIEPRTLVIKRAVYSMAIPVETLFSHVYRRKRIEIINTCLNGTLLII